MAFLIRGYAKALHYFTNQRETVPIAPAEAFLEPFDPRLALLHRPHVAPLGHLLRDLSENVSVFQAALQRSLHRVLPPNVQQVQRLVVRPGNLGVRRRRKSTFLRVCNQTGRVDQNRAEREPSHKYRSTNLCILPKWRSEEIHLSFHRLQRNPCKD